MSNLASPSTNLSFSVLYNAASLKAFKAGVRVERDNGSQEKPEDPKGVVSEVFAGVNGKRSPYGEPGKQGSVKPGSPPGHSPGGRENGFAAPPPLLVRFFGGFEIYCHDTRVPTGPNNKALAILKYLLVHKPQPVSQERLMDLLWPDSSPKKARWSLNSAVYALRRLCSEGLPPGESSDYILLRSGYYRLAPGVQVSSDVEEFDARCREGRRLEKSGSARQAVREYERAVELYRGDYLAEDLYEDWTMIERERLLSAYTDALDRLANYYLETGHYQKSTACCYSLLVKDGCHENSYRLLMRSYARLGQRARALDQYRLCEVMLQRRYGMTPSPETRSLYESLVGGADI